MTRLRLSWKLSLFLPILILTPGPLQDLLFVSAEVYSPYQYDMSAPTFTPDGRLLQLEYAGRASDHSPPIFILPLQSSDEALEQEKMNGSTATASSQQQLLAIFTYRPSIRLQERLLLYRNMNSNSMVNNAVRGRSVMIGLAGIAADCTALARKVQQDSLQHQRMFGVPFSTARDWAMAASRHCHSHACGGGIRPYGAHFVVIESGSNHDDDQQEDGSSPQNSNICITDPSGAIQTLSTGDIDRPTVLVGGGLLRESNVKRSLELNWPTILKRCSTPAAQLACAFDIIEKSIQEHLHGKDSKRGRGVILGREKSDLMFEVVLLSKKRGFYKLSTLQINRIRNSLLANSKG